MSQERLATVATSSDLGWSPDKVKDIDIITARGLVEVLNPGRMVRLGKLLHTLRAYESARTKTDLQDRMSEDRVECYALAADMMKRDQACKSLSETQRGILCMVAVTEWIHDRCKACKGAGAIERELGGTITCHACNGSKKHYFSDTERAEALRTVPNRMRHYNPAMQNTLQMCETAVRIFTKEANAMLGRWGE